MKSLPLMVFAAGKGTRMRPLTDRIPKPLVPVAGRPLLDHALTLARAARCTPIVVNTHHLADQIESHLSGQNIRLSHEPLLLETGGGLRAALPLLGAGPVMVLNSDAVWTGLNPLTQLLQAWDGARMDALLLTLPAALATGYLGKGDFVADAAGRLSRAHGRPAEVYLGAQILMPDDLFAITDAAFSLNLVWDRMIARNRLFRLQHQGGWCDVGRPDSLPLAEALLSGSP